MISLKFKVSCLKFLQFIAFCFLLTAYSFAQYPGFKPVANSESIKKSVQDYAAKTNSIESDFKQTKHLSMLTENSVSKGKFWFKKENLLRWEYKEPLQYVMVLNSGKAVIKENGKLKKFDMTGNRIFKQVDELMLAAVNGKILENADYTVSFFENSETVLAELLPQQKNMKAYVKNIVICFDKKDFSVSKFRMNELSGDYTEVEFTGRKPNVSIENSIFTVN